MTRLATLILAVAAAGAAYAQENRPAQEPRQAQPVQQPQNQSPPQTAVPLPPAQAEAMRRRDERSVDLGDLLAKVSASTGKRFLVDPRVIARVYSIPQITDPTYDELLSMLRLHGYAAIEVEGRTSIVPDANVRFMPVRLVQRDDDNIPDDEWVMRVIDAPRAAQIVPIVRPLMPPAAHLAAFPTEDGSGGKLVLMDTYANVRRMTELINQLAR
jgi:type II secretory pathway component GspD/PulD (secretin)